MGSADPEKIDSSMALLGYVDYVNLHLDTLVAAFMDAVTDYGFDLRSLTCKVRTGSEVGRSLVFSDGDGTSRRVLNVGLTHLTKAKLDVAPMIRNEIAKYKAKLALVPPATDKRRSVVVLQGSAIEAKPITWLWVAIFH